MNFIIPKRRPIQIIDELEVGEWFMVIFNTNDDDYAITFKNSIWMIPLLHMDIKSHMTNASYAIKVAHAHEEDEKHIHCSSEKSIIPIGSMKIFPNHTKVKVLEIFEPMRLKFQENIF